ncbi:unnamed protein product [Brassica oleracea]|uniref:(rape) hypothetical protein n=1 Tax=Brassica napus TaxID=3708 RepID=A0A816JCV3_BRANA|nr:unnamed protein product [Brassica napus]
MSTYAYESLLLFQAYAVEASSVVVLDSGIYVISGLIDGEKRTYDVWSLDCWTHVWHPFPSMGAARAYGLLVW